MEMKWERGVKERAGEMEIKYGNRICRVAYALKAFSICLKVFNRFRAITLDWVLPKKIPAIFIPYPLT